MANRELNVLFLCTGNSARSIMAECAMNRWGKGKFKAFSAGSHPAGAVHPMTLQLLNELNYETSALRSKSWDEFARAGSAAAGFRVHGLRQNRGRDVSAMAGTANHGALGREPIPRRSSGSDEAKRRFFFKIYTELENRIKIFTSLPFDSLDRFALERRVREIGTVKPPEDK